MRVFRPARPGSAARNLGKTALQTLVFWAVFLIAGPLLIRWLEGRLGVPALSFPGQWLAALCLATPAATLNLASGYVMAVAGEGTPFPTDTARKLVIRGPYRYLRNPMAVGGLGLGAAVGLFLGSWLTLVYVIAGGVLWNAIARPMEERELGARFGAPYEAYRARVRCWIPGPSGEERGRPENRAS